MRAIGNSSLEKRAILYDMNFKENVLNHIQIIHSSVPSPLLNKKQFKCTECDYTNLINDYVINHMKTAHPKRYKCGE